MSELKTKTIAQQMAEFEHLLAWFDSEDFELEAGLEKYRQAEKLAEEIENQLAKVKNEVEVLKTKFDQPHV